jgi:glycosidase
MIWESEHWDTDLRSFYQKLIHLRRTSPALIDGGFQMLLIEKDILAYLRDTDDEQIIVIGNRSANGLPVEGLSVSNGGIPDGTVFKEIFSGQTTTIQNGYLPLTAIPSGVQIWQSASLRG